jgi:type IV secretory pathway VirB3-like protein
MDNNKSQSLLFMGVNLRFFFVSVLLCTLICINAHIYWGVLVFVVIHLLALRLSVQESSFHLNTKSFIKTPPMLNRWYWEPANRYEQLSSDQSQNSLRRQH